MSQPLDWSTWWDLRLARGEVLSEQERRLDDAEAARQDREAPPLKSDREALKAMRQQVLDLGRDNAALRSQVADLETEIRAVEQARSEETRQALGVGE